MIKFYREKEKNGYLSNFYKTPITIDGFIWPTTEHYFQAMKFETTKPELMEKIRKLGTPGEAKIEGGKRWNPLRPDWEQVQG